ncbi:PIN domain-containing protein [Jiella sp. 40Bstr34]|uniref:Ribonuclease VapC n=1 Tax=Jiella pacifica TaxID=2696469 RepID=A0A6N9T6C3_9HYPH|nr:PIN domain-containing protein [Jiella pacifica]
MVVDTSALVAILLSEPDGEGLAGALIVEREAAMAAPSFLETSIGLNARIGSQYKPRLEALVASTNIQMIPFTKEMADIAAVAWQRYDRGSGSAAKLNFGDCFSYALAQSLDAPLLFKGDDFAATDVTAALAP